MLNIFKKDKIKPTVYKTPLINLATEYPNLRFPEFNLDIYSDRLNGCATIWTFIPSKNKKRLIYFSQKYYFDRQFSWNKLERFKDKFLEEGESAKKTLVFNKENTVYEPFAFNRE